jgi:hypothetical protein
VKKEDQQVPNHLRGLQPVLGGPGLESRDVSDQMDGQEPGNTGVVEREVAAFTFKP